MLPCVSFYIRKTLSTAMNTISFTKQHCPSIAPMWVHGTSAIWSGFGVGFGLNYGAEDRTQEVRG